MIGQNALLLCPPPPYRRTRVPLVRRMAGKGAETVIFTMMEELRISPTHCLYAKNAHFTVTSSDEQSHGFTMLTVSRTENEMVDCKGVFGTVRTEADRRYYRYRTLR